jgi:hypothetical protein
MYRSGKLIRESEWMRVYESPRFGRVYESKFLADGLEVPAESIISRWPRLSFAERIEFSNAFAAKPQLTVEDERILDFLMDIGSFEIWMAIAPLLPRSRNRERALKFLLDRIGEGRLYSSNFFQAAETMNDRRAVPALRSVYDRYGKTLQGLVQAPEKLDYVDYLQCCRALWVLEGSPEYRKVIEEFSRSSAESVRSLAERLLTGD